MKNNIEQQETFYQEDEIDLRELFLTIKKNKRIIFIITVATTILAILYIYIKTPIYETKAMVEIGNYKLNNNKLDKLDNAPELSKKLNIVFVDMHKNDENVKSKIISISVPKNSKIFIEIKANGISNKLAKESILEVVQYIQKSHQLILDDIKKRRKFEINNIDRKIQNIQNKETKFWNEKITLQEDSLKQYKKQLLEIDKNLKKIEIINPTLAALKLMRKRDLSDFILKLNMQLIELKDKRDSLATNAIWDLKEKKNLLVSMLLPYNYKNSQIIGGILMDDYPAKPKGKLIVIVAFITGLILSIFLVFFLEFVKGLTEGNLISHKKHTT